MFTIEGGGSNTPTIPPAPPPEAALYFTGNMYFHRTPSAGDRTKWIMSVWVNPWNISFNHGTILAVAGTSNEDRFLWRFEGGVAATDNYMVIEGYTTGFTGAVTDMQFFDLNAFYHLLLSCDMSATTGEELRLWINGEEATWSSYDVPGSGNLGVFRASQHRIGQDTDNTDSFAGMMAQFTALEGVSIQGGDYAAPDAGGQDFGYFDGPIWRQVGTEDLSRGTEGWLLDFTDATSGTTLGYDEGSGTNDWTDVGADVLLQTQSHPANLFGNWDIHTQRGGLTWSSIAYGGHYCGYNIANWYNKSSRPQLTGKIYYEYDVAETTYPFLGITANLEQLYSWNDTKGACIDVNGGATMELLTNDTATATDNLGAASVGSIIQVAFDADTGEVWLGENNTWGDFGATGVGDPAAGTNPAATLTGEGPFYAMTTQWHTNANSWTTFGHSGYSYVATGNADENGYGDFEYAPPSGFLAICTKNLTGSAPTVTDPSEGTVTAYGLGTDCRNDLISATDGWTGGYILIMKNVDAVEDWRVVFSDDSTKKMSFNTDAAKVAVGAPEVAENYIGLVLRNHADYGVFTDTVSHTFAGGDTQVAHGLTGHQGKLMGIIKREDGTGDWYVTHPGLSGSDYNINLNDKAAETNTYHTTIDDTYITVESTAATGTYRVIALAQELGFSCIHYHDNMEGGGVIENGFAPAWALYRENPASAFYGWEMVFRASGYNEYNPTSYYIAVDSDAADASGALYFLSNGIHRPQSSGRMTTKPIISLSYAERPYGGGTVPQAPGR